MAEINVQTLDMSKTLSQHLEIEGATITLKPGTYDATLPADITAEQAAAVHKHDVNYVNGFAHAASQAGVELLSKNKEYQQVTANTKVGNSDVDIVVKREGTVTIPPKEKGGEPGRQQVPGQTTVRVSQSNGAEIKRITKAAAAMAEKLGLGG